MSIKNYTSTVPANKSIMMIEHLLVSCGAVGISKFYDDNQKIEGIIFQMKIPEAELPITFKLPSRVDRVFQSMWADVKRPSTDRKKSVLDQAERTAFKLLYDWVAVQMSLIKLNQIEFTEVFLPYAYDGKETFFERIKGDGMKLLTN